MSKPFRVAEFAKLAGVTVRTLHHYDRINLLKPSSLSESGHRQYTREDLLRLQQILTLKWMGFNLSQIKDLLNSPDYNLRDSLSIQKAAVDAQITRLQAASEALSQAIDASEDVPDSALDSDMIATIIRCVTASGRDEWARRYYSEDAWTGIQTRRMTFTQAQAEQVQRDWQDLYDAFAALQDQSVDSPAVQRLAAKMDRLVKGFTGGDPEALAGLARLRSDPKNLPVEHRMSVDPELQAFMQRAWAIYNQRK